MAIKAISQFDAATPTSNDKILFEQNGEGKSTTLANLPVSTKTQTALDAKTNTSDVRTLEEIQATTDLTGKIAGADSIKTLSNNDIFRIKKFSAENGDNTSVTFTNVPIAYRVSAIVIGNANGYQFFRYCALFSDGNASQCRVSEGSISGTDNGDGTANITISSSVNSWGNYCLIVFY